MTEYNTWFWDERTVKILTLFEWKPGTINRIKKTDQNLLKHETHKSNSIRINYKTSFTNHLPAICYLSSLFNTSLKHGKYWCR